jgi:hypothetical protein
MIRWDRILQIGLGAIWIVGVILFHYHGSSSGPGPTALWGFGLLVFIVITSTVIRMIVERRSMSEPLDPLDSPRTFRLQTISNRANRLLKAEFPEECDRSVWFMSEEDNKVHEIAIVLKGEMARRLQQAFPGDPAGAWMFSEAEQTRLSRMREIVLKHAETAPETVVRQPLVIFDSKERFDAAIAQADDLAKLS